MAECKAWAVETMHTDPKIGWVLQGIYVYRNEAWARMRDCRLRWPNNLFRTVRYVPNPEGKQP